MTNDLLARIDKSIQKLFNNAYSLDDTYLMDDVRLIRDTFEKLFENPPPFASDFAKASSDEKASGGESEQVKKALEIANSHVKLCHEGTVIYHGPGGMYVSLNTHDFETIRTALLALSAENKFMLECVEAAIKDSKYFENLCKEKDKEIERLKENVASLLGNKQNQN